MNWTGDLTEGLHSPALLCLSEGNPGDLPSGDRPALLQQRLPLSPHGLLSSVSPSSSCSTRAGLTSTQPCLGSHHVLIKPSLSPYCCEDGVKTLIVQGLSHLSHDFYAALLPQTSAVSKTYPFASSFLCPKCPPYLSSDKLLLIPQNPIQSVFLYSVFKMEFCDTFLSHLLMS